MAESVAESLWAMHHGRAGAPSLIFPTTRDGAPRVSEQESKILLSRWLEREDVPHSVETPTVESYQQKGRTPLSGRIDVTVYGSREPDDRIVNVELKKGPADEEAFRKDFEKLLREGTDGLWFHTLDQADTRTWRAIEGKIGSAFETESRHLETARHSLSFAFCVLTPPQFVWFALDLAGHFESQWPQAMRAARGNPSTPGWWTETPGASVASTSARAARETSPKGHERWLVYCREICPDSFVHLNIQGSSYRLRFGCFRPRGWVDREAPTTEDLLSRYEFTHRIDVGRERKSVVKAPQYWVDRISGLNRQYGIRPPRSEQR